MPSLNNLLQHLLKLSSNFYLPITQRIAYFKGESQEILRLKEKNNSTECDCNLKRHKPVAIREG
jgi:hypothetical protein